MKADEECAAAPRADADDAFSLFSTADEEEDPLSVSGGADADKSAAGGGGDATQMRRVALEQQKPLLARAGRESNSLSQFSNKSTLSTAQGKKAPNLGTLAIVCFIFYGYRYLPNTNSEFCR